MPADDPPDPSCFNPDVAVTRALWVTNMWPDARRPWYGSFVRQQAESLREAGVNVDVVYIPGYLGQHQYLRGIAALRRAIRLRQYDIVHAHYGHSAVIARLQTQAAAVVSYCGDDLLGSPRPNGGVSRSSRLLACAFAQLARTATATITKSEAMASRLPTTCQARNHVIPNGVDLARFAPISGSEARRMVGWPDEPPNGAVRRQSAASGKESAACRTGLCGALKAWSAR